ncbi:ferritin-like domain-containing protein [Cubamyces menziesii]|nr:ferritin-like domain-containing protein [Cubamyces menziesii]
MFRKAILLALVGAATTLGQALSGWDDTSLTQYLLTLQHVENAFFSQGLDTFADTDFADAGYPTWVRNRISQIAAHEAAHVADLTDALGEVAPAACTYNFPITDVDSFIDLAQQITTIEASAGIGAVGFINGTGLEIYAASIAAAESRHAGWLTSAVEKRQPWDGPWETPLSPNEAYSLLVDYIGDCPDTNPSLPFKTYPALTVYPGYPAADGTVYVSLTLKAAASTFYLAWLDGLTVQYSPIANGQATVPEGLDGTVYVAVVSSQAPPSDSNLVSGLAVVQFPFDSWATDTDPTDLPKKTAQ